MVEFIYEDFEVVPRTAAEQEDINVVVVERSSPSHSQEMTEKETKKPTVAVKKLKDMFKPREEEGERTILLLILG